MRAALALLLLLSAPAIAQTAKPRPVRAAPDLTAIARLIESGDLAAAEQQLLAVLAGSPGLSEARQQLARVYLAQKRDAETLAELRRAAAAGPLERDLAMKLAGLEVEAGRPLEAARQLRSVADRFQSVQALLQLARVQSGQKDAKGALESLRRAIVQAPNAEDVLLAQAQLSLGLRAPVPAIFALEPLARMCPTVAQYHYLLGVALMQAGDMPAAVAPLQEAERLEPRKVLTLVALGLALNSRKLHAEARTYLQQGLELEPENVEVAAALAEAEEGLGEVALAEAHASRVLTRAEGHATANLVLGLVRMKQERYADARDHLERAVAADPASPKGHYQLSLAYARLGDTARAQKEVALYQEKLKEIEERLTALRTQTGSSSAGMRP